MPKKKRNDSPGKKAAGTAKKTSGRNPKKPMEAVSGSQKVDFFPVEGIGASAGCLEAFRQFFTNMPSDAGIAFVLIRHLGATHKSIVIE